jgi:hypothetical protein
MNLLKEFWNWFTTPKEDACCTEPQEATPVEVEEDCCGKLFLEMLQRAGISKYVIKVNGVELFEGWYDGPCTEEAILEALPGFKEVYPVVGAKMCGRL